MRHTIPLALALSVIVTGCAPADAAALPTARAAGGPKLISTGVPGVRTVGDLRVARKSSAKYSRDAFGGWADPDRNGCDARNDVLRRDLTAAVLVAGSKCLVKSGQLVDRYTGRRLTFTRGVRTSGLIQIDHVVPVADAWKSGASTWTSVRRAAFYNDPMNLVAVEGKVNQAKSAKTADQYLPAINACRYAQTVIDVKAKWALTVSAAEKAALGGACK